VVTLSCISSTHAVVFEHTPQNTLILANQQRRRGCHEGLITAPPFGALHCDMCRQVYLYCDTRFGCVYLSLPS
jgi:hypothetical protein